MGDARNEDPAGVDSVNAARMIEDAGVADESAACVHAIGEADETPDAVTGDDTKEAERDAEAHPS